MKWKILKYILKIFALLLAVFLIGYIVHTFKIL